MVVVIPSIYILRSGPEESIFLEAKIHVRETITQQTNYFCCGSYIRHCKARPCIPLTIGQLHSPSLFLSLYRKGVNACGTVRPNLK